MATYTVKNPVKTGMIKSFYEREYIKNTLIPFIEKKSKFNRTRLDGKDYVVPDYESRIRFLLANYMVEHFTLPELRIVFAMPKNFTLEADFISENRRYSIKRINSDNSLTYDEKERLKRKVWDLNSVTYGLILELIKSSDLFREEKNYETITVSFSK
jgi:hypothetical protein